MNSFNASLGSLVASEEQGTEVGSHLYTPGATLPATCHLKATEAAARQAPKTVIDRGTAMMAASANRGDTTVLRAAAAAGAPICTNAISRHL